ncbi:hypothetical protein [Salegentibacter echinorum]|nr:hypothetical protein [Salegentibacter echinorum]
MLVTSCSKEDNGDGPDGPKGGDEMAALGFNALLQGFNKSVLTKQQTPGTQNNGLPECPEDSEEDLFVRVQLLTGATGDNVYEKDGDSHFDVPIIPQSDGTWLTGEGSNDELELPEGVYRLNYFGVYASGGDDNDDNDDTLLYLAPRDDDNYGPAQYQNFVDDALPSNPFSVNNGQKKYVDVQVLCYDEHFVNKYGYLFFDFEEVDILYLCLFGNVCDEETGRHTPAVFEFEVWNYSGDSTNPKGSPLFVAGNELKEGTDEYGTYEYAEPVCVQLPDAPGEIDTYYGEVYLLNSDGTRGDLIRFGMFDETGVRAQDYSVDGNGDSTSNYYHFREGNCSNQDDSDPCLFSAPVEYSNDFDGDDDKAFLPGITGIAGNYVDKTTATPSNTANSGTMQDEGTYGFFTSPSQVHSNWINLTGSGNMLIINGEDDEANTSPYFVISEEQICPDSEYFISFDIVNVLKNDNGGGNNNVDLAVRVNGTLIPGANIVAPYSSGSQSWMSVGLKLRADGNGDINCVFENAETAANGNDFAIDNIVISNDQNTLDGSEDVTIIQP